MGGSACAADDSSDKDQKSKRRAWSPLDDRQTQE
jgi:hypothetical protein